jgi:hypothetical protein
VRAGGVLEVTTSPVAGGTHALTAFELGGGTASGWASLFFADHPELGGSSGAPVDDVYFSSQVRFSPGFEFQSGKMFILASFDGWAAGYAQPNSWSPFYLLLQVDSNGEPEGVVHDKTTGTSLWRAMHRNVGASDPLQTGRWYELGYRVKLNAPGRADGVFQVWIDGILKLDYRDVVYRAQGSSYDWNHFMLSPYQSNVPSADQEQYWDDVMLVDLPASQPIETSPPVRPALLGRPGKPYVVQ